MLSRHGIKIIIGKYIDKTGKKRFAIYPFGENGISVKEELIERYGIKDVILVDNYYSKYNKSIMSFEELLAYDKDRDYTILLSIEEQSTHRMMLDSLLYWYPMEQVLDLDILINGKDNFWPLFNEFRANSFLPDDYLLEHSASTKKIEKELIKVRIYNFTDNCWNSLMSIAQEFKEDNNVDLLILGRRLNDSQLVYEELMNHGYTQSYIEEYSAKADRPDIFILSHSCDVTTQIPDLHRYCKLVVVASMDLLRYTHNWNSFWNMYESAFKRFEPDVFLFDTLLYNDIVRNGYKSERFIEMGNAKFDGIYNAVINKMFPKEWEKLKKTDKIILYATDHGVHDMMITEDITFDLYGADIMDYAYNNENIGLIFRPHPTLIMELLRLGIWDSNTMRELEIFCESTSNIVFDISSNYNAAMALCDAVITDAYCGITCEAIPLNKPILMLYRGEKYRPYHTEIEMCNYRADNMNSINGFLEMVIKGEDDKRETRERLMPHMIKNFDGLNGKRIKELIMNKYIERRRL